MQRKNCALLLGATLTHCRGEDRYCDLTCSCKSRITNVLSVIACLIFDCTGVYLTLVCVFIKCVHFIQALPMSSLCIFGINSRMDSMNGKASEILLIFFCSQNIFICITVKWELNDNGECFTQQTSTLFANPVLNLVPFRHVFKKGRNNYSLPCMSSD